MAAPKGQRGGTRREAYQRKSLRESHRRGRRGTRRGERAMVQGERERAGTLEGASAAQSRGGNGKSLGFSSSARSLLGSD